MLCLVAQSCLTLCDPMDCSSPDSSVYGDSPDKNTRVGCHALLQGIFPTQGLNPGLQHCRQILYHGTPWETFLKHGSSQWFVFCCYKYTFVSSSVSMLCFIINEWRKVCFQLAASLSVLWKCWWVSTACGTLYAGDCQGSGSLTLEHRHGLRTLLWSEHILL